MMTKEEILQKLKGCEERAQRSQSENSTIPSEAWRGKYAVDVPELIGIIKHLLDSKHEQIEETPQRKSKKSKRQTEDDDS